MGVSDEELVARAVTTEDTSAFETLVERHQSRVRNWLRQLTGDSAEAHDLAQETFIRAWRGLRSFSGKGKFASWLMRIAYTTYLQSHRKRTREKRLAASLGAAAAGAGEAPDTQGLVDLPKMLSVLTDDERVAMILCYAHGLSHGEISEITDMPLGTVKSHIRRGKLRIRERFKL